MTALRMTFLEWEDELESLVRTDLGFPLSEVRYDRALARRACRDGDSPREFMEEHVASLEFEEGGPVDALELGIDTGRGRD